METQLTVKTINPAGLVVRKAMAQDLPDLEWDGEFTHFRRVFADAYDRQISGSSMIWVAYLSGVGLVGQLFIQFLCDRHELADGDCRAYLYSFRVKPLYRSLGVGSHVMDVVENDLRLRGFQYVTLNVAKENFRAQDLYRRRGYHVIASESGRWSYPDHMGIWHHVEEPAWRMEKKL